MGEQRNKTDSIWRPIIAGLVLIPILFYASFLGTREWLSDNLHDTSKQTLNLYVAGLDELLNRYKALPEIYALHPAIQNLLHDPDDADLRQQANILLKTFNTSSQAAETYILDSKGTTLAASNWDQPVTFVGRNFSFRPYFQDAMKTGKGRFFALGTTSFQRGYYMSRAVINSNHKPVGVVVVKINVAQAEAGWGSPSHKVMVTDNASIVFLSSSPDWLYKAVRNPSSKALVELDQTRRYANKKIGRLPFSEGKAPLPWQRNFTSRHRNAPSYLAAYHDLDDAGWRVWILADAAPMRITAFAYAAATVLVISLTVIAVLSLVARRRGLLRALDVQQRARRTLENSASELERQVEKRTADLKRAHNELVQADKMAALGQMSVGINHELNQPLTAIRAYTDNAVKFLKQNRTAEAEENLSLIAALSERMGDIILRLKIFARESSDERTSVSLQSAISDTMRIVNPQLKKARVDFSTDLPDQDIRVLVNNVRLEQVLVNLINNAIDALREQDNPRITLSARIEQGEAVIRVHDNGPGIPDDVIAHLFEPFFTTKEIGLGLGLGLSISYGIIQEFGGELTARNLAGGGAEFTFNIPLINET